MIKKVSHIILLCILMSTSLVAQQLPISNLYFLDDYMVNSSAAGQNELPSIYANHRKQWVNIDGAPATSYLGFHSQAYKNLSFGLKYTGDQSHILSANRALFSLAYALQINSKLKLSVGLAGGILDQRIDPTGINVNDYSDDLIEGGKLSASSFTSEAGLSIYGDNFLIGFSVPQLIPTQSTFLIAQSNKNLNTINHYLAHARYKIKVSKKINFTPYLMYYFTPVGQSQMDIQGLISYNEKFNLGLGYRLKESILVSLGFNLNKNLQIAYSYGIPGSGISQLSSGTHEIGIAFKFGRKEGISTDDQLDSLIIKTTELEKSQAKQDSLIASKDKEIKLIQDEIEKYKDSLELLKIIRDEIAKSPNVVNRIGGNNIPSDKIEVGKNYAINGIQFEFNSFDLTPKSKNNLKDVVTFLNKYPTVELAIHGYTDNVGADLFNLILSKNRARAVFLFLAENGIRASRLRFDGFGESNPVASNSTEKGKAKNRRIEFVILSK